jgi:hypothetical protein
MVTKLINLAMFKQKEVGSPCGNLGALCSSWMEQDNGSTKF